MQVKSVCLAVALAGAALSVQAGPVLDAVRARGQVICGVNTAAPGFPVWTAAATGAVLMSIRAVRWRLRFWGMLPK